METYVGVREVVRGVVEFYLLMVVKWGSRNVVGQHCWNKW